MKAELTMRVTKLKIEWHEPISAEHPREQGTSTSVGILSRIGIQQQLQKRCPRCESIVYSRRNILCGVCGHVLPSACLFEPHEAQKVAQMIERERERYRKWIKQSANL